MTYASERRLCPLVEGFIEGTADHFGEKIEYEAGTLRSAGRR